MSMRLADPKPGFCSSCFNSSPELRYVDFDAAWDGPVIIDPERGTAKIWPGGVPSSNDDLYLCESCVQRATEILGLKATLNARQGREIRRLQLEAEHWRDYARELESTLAERPEPAPNPRVLA